LLDGLEPTFYPTFWFEITTELDDTTSDLLKWLGVAPKLGIVFGLILIAIGLLTASITFFFIFKNMKKPEKNIGNEKTLKF
jgi:uncharacterized protein YjeT (DUF2065 family)